MLSTVAVNGEVKRWEDLRLHDFAQGFFFGAGFFTTFRIEDGAPLFLSRHLRRLTASLAAHTDTVRAPSPELLEPASVRDTLRRCLAADPLLGPRFQGIGKLSASDGQLLLTLRPHAPDAERLQHEGRAILTVEHGAYRHGETSPNHKGLSYFRQFSRMQQLPVLANELAHACELPTANLFVLLDGALVTPPLDAPCLPGVIRAVLLDSGSIDGVPIMEQALPLARLAEARAGVFTNAAVLATGVPRLLGHTLPESLSLAARLREHILTMASRED
ncbi:aminotransferase class IV [Myxococcus sp. XM-1-1-1]|uniref:aminotransferase class IV n=1 Tax=Myxococcus sp. XM-1-1-1 TaxID=2874602 RepID=UPI001CBC970A|nr:aminotransferase class IV [Myxococcus sp. XM-1-1-1]MBZ4409834.1 aminotransferase class IV [Myxococcus sp. XM-1-1-1]